MVADAEHLPFPDATFDIVYSYGVLHHSPDTRAAVKEVHRVLKPGGTAIVMVYHHPSWAGFMLWGVHYAAHMGPWVLPRQAVFIAPGEPRHQGLWSTRAEASSRTSPASTCGRSSSRHGDLLLMPPAAKYRGWKHQLAWRLYPRWLVRRLGHRLGTGLMIEAVKAGAPDRR